MSDSEEPTQNKMLFRTSLKAKKDLTASLKSLPSFRESGGSGGSKDSGALEVSWAQLKVQAFQTPP